MTKEMREIQADILEKTKDAEALLAEGKVDEAEKKLDEIDGLQKKLEVKARLNKANKAGVVDDAEPVEGQEEEPEDSTKAFADAARRGFKSMNEGTPAAGGYTVPEDIVTKIQKLRESKASLLNLVTVEKVNTNKGARTFKARAQQTGFTKVGEAAKIGAKNTPQFTRVEYEIEKYAGYFPVTNELLADSDVAIVDTIDEWIADESRVTANKLIMEKVNTKDVTALTSLDDIKKVLTVTLGAAFKATSKVITNDDGLHWLDTLKDADDKYLLQPSPADPMALRLCAGATVVPVEVIPNTDLPTGEDGIPFVIGDLKEGIVYWDRQELTIKADDTAVAGDLNAFEEDLTLFRAIEREAVSVRDAAAFVNGRLSVGAAG